MTAGLWRWRDIASERNAEPAFCAITSLVFAVSTTVTIVWSSGMSAMGEMAMPGGWTMSMAWMRMPDQNWPQAAASWLSMWLLMMVAMMMPSLVASLCRYRDAVTADVEGRLGRLTAIVAAGYFGVWSVVGFVVFALGSTLAVALMTSESLSRAAPLGTALAVLVAGVSQFSARKAHHLACCRRSFAPRTALPADASTAWRHGVRLGLHCSYSSAGLTAVLLVMGVMDLRVMAVVTAAVTAERLAPAGQIIARINGCIVIGAGMALMARASGLP